MRMPCWQEGVHARLPEIGTLDAVPVSHGTFVPNGEKRLDENAQFGLLQARSRFNRWVTPGTALRTATGGASNGPARTLQRRATVRRMTARRSLVTLFIAVFVGSGDRIRFPMPSPAGIKTPRPTSSFRIASGQIGMAPTHAW